MLRTLAFVILATLLLTVAVSLAILQWSARATLWFAPRAWPYLGRSAVAVRSLRATH